MMHAPDLDLVRDIPGYKVILKAVLRSQIQQLVEQLAKHTDEESVLITANMSDGTLCHLGSDSGKHFLEDHEDVKTQFLGFCLKRFHNKPREPDKQTLHQAPHKQLYNVPSPKFSPKIPHNRPRGPASVSRAPTSLRHDPYARTRPSKPVEKSPMASRSAVPDHMKIPMSSDGVKLEPGDTGSMDTTRISADTTSHSRGQSPAQTSSLDTKPDAVDRVDSSSGHVALHADESLKEAMDRSSDSQCEFPGGSVGQAMPGPSSSGELDTSNSGDYDAGIVKAESQPEPEFDLDMSGMEQGTTASQEAWGPEGMGYDPSGATGNPADLQGGDQSFSAGQKPDQSQGAEGIDDEEEDDNDDDEEGEEEDDDEKVFNDYLKGYVGNVVRQMGHMRHLGNVGNMGDLGSMGNVANIGNLANMGNAGNSPGASNVGFGGGFGFPGTVGGAGTAGFGGNVGDLSLSVVGQDTNQDGEEIYACAHCPKRYKLKRNLLRHRWVHERDRQRKCPLCPYLSSRSDLLAKHMATHLH